MSHAGNKPIASANFRRALRATRRKVLQAGLAGALGLGLPALWHSQASAGSGASGFGRAKRCIFRSIWDYRGSL